MRTQKFQMLMKKVMQTHPNKWKKRNKLEKQQCQLSQFIFISFIQQVSYEDADDEDNEALTLAKEKDEGKLNAPLNILFVIILTDDKYDSEMEEDADTSRKTSKKINVEGKHTNMSQMVLVCHNLFVYSTSWYS